MGRPSLTANPIELNDLQRALSAASSFSSELHLSSILSADVVQRLVLDTSCRQRLLCHLPENAPQTFEELQALVQSPQFHQALQIFNAILHSEHSDSILTQFGFDPVDSGGQQGVEGFLRALQRHATRAKQQERHRNGTG
jgi:hypothetical protein